MKKDIFIYCIAGLFSLGACDNGNRGDQQTNNMEHQPDTSAITGELNPRGLPEEGIPDDNTVTGDTVDVGTHDDLMTGLPARVAEKIRADRNLRDKKLTNARKYSEGGTVYYELTFENGRDSQVIFDEEGNEPSN